MTSISSTSLTSHHKPHKMRQASAAETAPLLDLAASTGTQTSSPDKTSATVSIDKLLSQVIDLLHKLQKSDGIQAGDQDGDGEDNGGNIADIVATMDADGDGMVSSAEFAAARPKNVTEDQATQLFKFYDAEGKGTLSVAELTRAINQDLDAHQPPPPAADLFSSLDANGDGVVSRDEFLAAMPKQNQQDEDINALLRLLGGKPDVAAV